MFGPGNDLFKINLAYVFLMLTLLVFTPILSAFDINEDELLALSIEELTSLTVTSVSRKEERIIDSAAAVYVITQEDIRRSGVNSIPAALAMVPGLQVNLMENNAWSISARGFNYIFTNKLLIMIDGRTLYTPPFSGVNWDMQDTFIQDIERIEVIRGPGAAVWGANAVSGVINIITKKAINTQGEKLVVSTGNKEKVNAGFRFGNRLSDTIHYSIFVKSFRMGDMSEEESILENNRASLDRLGIRIDWQPDSEEGLTLQGDIYKGTTYAELEMFDKTTQKTSKRKDRSRTQHGGYLLANWYKNINDKTTFSIKAYYDNFFSNDYRVDSVRDTIDLELQYRYNLTDHQELIWGFGYRDSWLDLSNLYSVAVKNKTPEERLFSAYIQHEMTFLDYWHLSLSARFEHHDSTGHKYQPNIKLSWSVNPRSTAWISFSGASRTPSITERDFTLQGVASPMFDETLTSLNLMGSLSISSDNRVEPEQLTAFEMGYRYQIMKSLSFDASYFYNKYSNLISISDSSDCFSASDALKAEPGILCSVSADYVLIPAVLSNDLDVKSYGFELAVNWDVTDWWRMETDVSYLKVLPYVRHEHQLSRDLHSFIENLSADYHANLRSMMTLGDGWSVDVWLRYEDENKSMDIEAFTTANIRVAQSITKHLSLSLQAENLFYDRHESYITETYRAQIEFDW